MSTTQHFDTNALYPGGEGKCGIGTHDPYPGGIPDGNIFKITKNIGDIWPLIWNLENWNVEFSFAGSIEEESFSGSSTAPMAYDAEIEGQFHSADAAVIVDDFGGSPPGIVQSNISGFVYDGEPFERVCEDGRRAVNVVDDGTTTTDTQADDSEPIILPKCEWWSIFAEDSEDATTRTASADILDSSSAVVGDVTVTRYSSNPGLNSFDVFANARVGVVFVRLLGLTVDIYFRVEAKAETSEEASWVLSNNNSTSPLPDGFAEAGTDNVAVAISILGESVGGFLWYQGSAPISATGRPPTTFNSFSLSYDVTVNTAYTY